MMRSRDIIVPATETPQHKLAQSKISIVLHYNIYVVSLKSLAIHCSRFLQRKSSSWHACGKEKAEKLVLVHAGWVNGANEVVGDETNSIAARGEIQRVVKQRKRWVERAGGTQLH